LLAADNKTFSPVTSDKGLKIGVCTIVAKNYLAHARTLMQSVKLHHPEFERFVLLSDEVENCFKPEDEDFTIHLSADLPIPKNSLFHLKYDVMELATAVKPYYLEQLLRSNRLDAVLYIDPDILLMDKLDPIVEALADANIVLTPHLLSPLEDTKRPSELDILKSGAYNLGFLAIRNTQVVAKMLTWWQKRLYNDCISDVGKGLFVDQRWIDLVPGMYPGVCILQDPTLNVAYWNIAHIEISRRHGKFFANNQPLRFFHFSGFNPDDPEPLSKHQNRFALEDTGDLRYLAEIYAQMLFDNGYRECRKWRYTYNFFSDGSQIPSFCRRLIRDNVEAQAELEGAFTPEYDQAIFDFFNEPAPKVSDEVLVTRLVYYLYQIRNDLLLAFPAVPGSDTFNMLRWFLNHAQPDYGLSDKLLEPIYQSLHTYVTPAFVGERLHQTPGFIDNFLIECLNRPVAPPETGQPLISMAAYHLYSIDSEAQASFSDPLGADRHTCALWFTKNAADKYALPDFLTQPVKNSLSESSTTVLPVPRNVLDTLRRGPGGQLLLEWLQSFVQPPNAQFRPRLTQFAYYLHELMPDLTAKYNLRTPKGWATYSQWFAKHVQRVYNVPEILVAPIRQQLSYENFRQNLNEFDKLLLNLFNRPVDATERLPVTIAAYQLYQTRSDLHRTFPNPLGTARESFVSWFIYHGTKLLHPALIEPVLTAKRLPVADIAGWPPNLLESLQEKPSGQLLLNWLNQDYDPATITPVRVTRLAHYIYEIDEYAQVRFTDILGADNLAFGQWLAKEGAQKYAIPFRFLKPLLDTLETQETEAVSDEQAVQLTARPVNLRRRLRLEVTRNLNKTVLGRWLPTAVTVLDPKPDMQMYFRQMETPAHYRRSAMGSAADGSYAPEPPFGLNLAGYLSAPTGVGEAARRTLSAMQSVNIPYTSRNIVVQETNDTNYNQEFREVGGRATYFANLFQVNADRTPETVQNFGRAYTEGRYNIGFWYWELSDFPATYAGSFDWLNEIWVATNFVQEAVAAKSPLPVVKIAPPIAPQVAPGCDRNYFGLPSERFLFLTMFDLASVYERKNPLGAIEAFRKAFGRQPNSNVGLVVKVSSGKEFADQVRELRQQVADLPVWIIDQYFSQAEINALTACCDSTISLHRSEGFGLTLAEAMYFGKPVVATAYSGNADFTRFDNSFLVDYELVKLSRNYGPYPQGSVWANPDTEHAALRLRQIVEDEPLRRKVAAKGQQFIRQHYAPEVSGKQIAARLEVIYKKSQKL
jgi:glycosyltransferase involved in cell wall biosynthesis